MAEYSANAVQTINPGESAVFTETVEPCRRRLIRHSDGTVNFLLSGWVPYNYGCPCCQDNEAEYLVDFHANIAVPTGGTIADTGISVGIAVDGGTVPASQMISTPAAVEQFNNVSVGMTVPVFTGCCQTVTVRNLSDQPILMQNALLRLTRPDLLYSR